MWDTNVGGQRRFIIYCVHLVRSYVVLGKSKPRRIAGSLLIPLSKSSFHVWTNSSGISAKAFPLPSLLMVKLWRVWSVDWRCNTSLRSKTVGSNKNRLGSDAHRLSIDCWYQAWSCPAGAESQPLIAAFSMNPAKSIIHFLVSLAKDRDCASWTTAEGRFDHSMNSMHGCSL